MCFERINQATLKTIKLINSEYLSNTSIHFQAGWMLFVIVIAEYAYIVTQTDTKNFSCLHSDLNWRFDNNTVDNKHL